MYWSTSSGRIELQITKAEARDASHQGQCDFSVLVLSVKPRISRQLAKLSPELVAQELKEWGAWEDEELKNHTQNIQRLLWLACCDVNEGNTA